MSSIFRGGHRANSTQPPNLPDFTLRVTTSMYGRVRPLGWGRCRVSGNVLLFWNLYSQAEYTQNASSPATSGGKGGLFGGGGQPSFGSTGWVQQNFTQTWRYFATVIMGFGDSKIVGAYGFYPGNGTYSAVVGASTYAGDYTQTDWPYTAGNSYSVAYRGESYLAFGPLDLGTTAGIPNYTFDMLFSINTDEPWGIPDANPADIITDYLTNPDYGVPSFSSSYLGDLTNFRTYCRAFTFLCSFTESQQRPAQSFLQDFGNILTVDYVWTEGKLNVVPLAYIPGSDNGYVWNPPTTPDFDLTDGDFIKKDPVGSHITVSRKSRSRIPNYVSVEYLPRWNSYNPYVIQHADEGAIANYGIEVFGDTISAHYFCLDFPAQRAAVFSLMRAQILTTYTFTVGAWFVAADPRDLVTLTESSLGLLRTPVSILEIQENSDGTYTVTAEDYPVVPSAPAWGPTATTLGQVNFNEDPGGIVAPLIFEPPAALAGGTGLAIWCAVCGVSPQTWGGCVVYASYDGNTYTSVGRIQGAPRLGVLATNYPAIAAAPSGQTIDSANTLAVDLTQSAGVLGNASVTDMQALNSLCFCDGELIAYQNASLSGAYRYNLSPCVRGAYGTPIAAHAAGARFARLDSQVIAIPFTPDRIGAQVYLKFASFNVFGGGRQQLSDVSPQTYTIQGSALAGPLPNITNLSTSFSNGFMQLFWDEVTDFRAGIRYQIWKGPTFNAATKIGDVAHPPFTLYGDDTYYVLAYCQPTTGLTVTSAVPTSLTVAGNQLVDNIVLSRDEQVLNWPGVLTNFTTSGSPGSEILLLNQPSATGYYELPWIDVGYAVKASVNVIWSAVGSPVGQDVLLMSDVLSQSDILGGSASASISSHIEIAVLGDATSTDIFAPSDIFSSVDIFGNTAAQWQKFTPGVYPGRYFKFRLVVSNASIATATGNVTALKTTISIPPRIDHYQNQSIAAGGNTIVFQPDGAVATRPFNGGPNGSTVPYVNVTWQNHSGDVLVISGLSLSQLTIQITNGGAGVARTGVNIDVEGY